MTKPKPPGSDELPTGISEAEKEKMEQELLKKVPPETSQGEERGERLATGKTIASGGTDKANTKKS